MCQSKSLAERNRYNTTGYDIILKFPALPLFTLPRLHYMEKKSKMHVNFFYR